MSEVKAEGPSVVTRCNLCGHKTHGRSPCICRDERLLTSEDAPCATVVQEGYMVPGDEKEERVIRHVH